MLNVFSVIVAAKMILNTSDKWLLTDKYCYTIFSHPIIVIMLTGVDNMEQVKYSHI